jgi:hypothetical protein
MPSGVFATRCPDIAAQDWLSRTSTIRLLITRYAMAIFDAIHVNAATKATYSPAKQPSVASCAQRLRGSIPESSA